MKHGKHQARPIMPGVYTSLSDLVRLQHKTRGFSFLPRQPLHSLLAGKHASKLRGRGLNFEEIKNYLPGDDIRAMDWKATLRTGKPQVRVFTEERDRPAFMVLDQRHSMFFGSRRKMKSVVAAELGALGAWRVFAQGDRAGAIIFNDEEAVEIRPLRSRQTVLRILGEIVRFNHKLGSDSTKKSAPTMLNHVLEKVSRLAPHDSLICIITDMTGADAQTRRIATRLARHNDLIVGFIYDPLEQDLPSAGKMAFSTGETQIEVDTSDRILRKRYADEFNERIANARRILLQQDVPMIPIQTGADPVLQIQKLLGYARSTRRSR
jgi:uncharacterized protein (DUF58 family)